eukprot:5939793-Amphidinium_carterae.1
MIASTKKVTIGCTQDAQQPYDGRRYRAKQDIERYSKYLLAMFGDQLLMLRLMPGAGSACNTEQSVHELIAAHQAELPGQKVGDTTS